jgi:PAS domain S-box-containing protein
MREQHAAIARECARFRFISDHVSDWIFLTDDSGRIELANRTASLRFGLDGADLTGQPIDELASSPERPAFRVLVEDCAKTGTSSGEILLSPREGPPVYAGIGCTAVRLEGKVVIHVAARDITERKLLDRQLREARQWESLRVLAGGLAHDFNNRLTAIMGNAMMAREELAGHPATAMLENIEEAGQRTAHLVQLMLATSGYRSLHAEPVRLDRILRNVLESGAFPGHVRLEADAPETGYLGDSLSFETLLQSLIANAAEAYGESPGEVKICLHPDSAPGPDAGSFEEGDTGSGKCVGIVVEDSGGGMTREVLERAFDPFFTTKFMGRGLGLPAVRGIVRAYSGKLRLRTREGEGTCVEVWLPHPD